MHLSVRLVSGLGAEQQLGYSRIGHIHDTNHIDSRTNPTHAEWAPFDAGRISYSEVEDKDDRCDIGKVQGDDCK